MILHFPLPRGHFAGGKNVSGSSDPDSLEHLLNQAGGRRPVVTVDSTPFAIMPAHERDILAVDVTAAGGPVTLNVPDDLPTGFALTILQVNGTTGQVLVAAPGTATVTAFGGGATNLDGTDAKAELLVHAANTAHLSGDLV